MKVNGRKTIVVLGMMTKIPVAGVVWQVMHYLVGFKRMGYDVYYVEAHARFPSMFGEADGSEAHERAAAFLSGVMQRFGFEHAWAYHAVHGDGRCYGMSAAQLNALYAAADLLINMHGGTLPLPEHTATGRLVYLETDPVELQIELQDNLTSTLEFLEPHIAFFTFGENYGRPGCKLPVSPRFKFFPTRQPVVLDMWQQNEPVQGNHFTTIGNWKQQWRSVTFEGETFTWSKHFEFLKFIDLPSRTAQTLELALSSYADVDRAMLEEHGWRVRPALDISLDADCYRHFISESRGEFTVAKDQNVRFRTGWFSDRSATYLAAGRPVVTQETGFSDLFPTGAGLFGFSTLDEAVGAIEAINSDYERHSSAAGSIAREYFSHDVVLAQMLSHLGV